MGIDSVFLTMKQCAETHGDSSDKSILINLRQKNLISETLKHVSDCIGNAGMVPDDVLSIDIREAVDCLGEITGDSTTDDILNSIFTNFCVGK